MTHRFYFYKWPIDLYYFTDAQYNAMHDEIDVLLERIRSDGYQDFIHDDDDGYYLECDDEAHAVIFKLAYT